MEVLEHVADVEGFLRAAAALVRPGGLFVGATLNRTLKSYALAIVGAEYLLRWVEPGTHDWTKFLRPEELLGPLQAGGTFQIDRAGVVYHPVRDEWRLSGDVDVNYMIAMERQIRRKTGSDDKKRPRAGAVWQPLRRPIRRLWRISTR